MDCNAPEIYEILTNSETIAVSAHVNPDGDAVGACSAIYSVLGLLGKKPVVYLEDAGEKFNFLSGVPSFKTPEYSDTKFDLFIALDCGSKDRLGELSKVFDNAKKTMSIDHHISNTNFAESNIVYPDSSSTCEVVYEVIKNFCIVNKDIAEAVYSGILTDTNGFMHGSTSPRTHEIASQLIKAGISTPDIHTKLLYSHTFTEMKVCGYAYSKAYMDDNICCCILSRDEIENKCGAKYNELDAIVSYLLHCEGAAVSVFVYEKPDGTTKVSMRSKGTDVSRIAVSHGGGGHVCAAGINFNDKTLEEAAKLIVKEIKDAIK